MCIRDRKSYGLEGFSQLVERQVGLDLVGCGLAIKDRDAIGESAAFRLVVGAQRASQHREYLGEVVGPELREPPVDEGEDRAVVDEEQRRSGEEALGECRALDDAGTVREGAAERCARLTVLDLAGVQQRPGEAAAEQAGDVGEIENSE